MEQILAEVAAMPLSIRRQTAKKSIAPHEAIVLKGDDADHVFILLKGDVRVLNEFSSGQRYSFAEYSAPSFIGEYEVMAEQSVYATTNEAITPCELISMRAEVFIEWVQGSASLAFLLARIIAEKSYPTSNENGRIKFLPGLQKLQTVFAVSLLPGRQQQLQHMLPHLCDDPQFFTMEYHDLLETTVPLYITPMIRQGVADGSIQTESPEALGEAIFLLADLWLTPQARPTTPARQRARCAVFQQMTQALGLDLLTDEQAEELAALCEAE